MKLILVRHGETVLNRQRRVLGRGDFPLTELGRLQAQAAGRALGRHRPSALYSSPVARAMETARIIGRIRGLEVVPLPGMAEADAGDLEGLTGEEFRRRFPDFVRRWSQDPATARMPGGETLQEVQERAWRAVMELEEAHPGETVAVVSHYMVTSAFLCRLLGVPLRWFDRLRQDVGAIATVRMDGDGGALLSLNDTCHLRGLEEGPG